MPETIDCEISHISENWYVTDLKSELLSWDARASATRIEPSSGTRYRRRGQVPTGTAIALAEVDASARDKWLIAEIHEVVRESHTMGVVPVDEDTEGTAIKFATILPSSLPAPEIAADPDGELSFDWLGSSDNMFSVSVDRNGRLAYAGRFSGGRKTNGVEQLSEVCPPEVLLGIEKATS